MSGRTQAVRSLAFLFPLAIAGMVFSCAADLARAQQRREREPWSVYAERRAKLLAQADGPIVLFGYTGMEEEAQTYLFSQEENFYYLTGYNDEGAGLLLVPESKNHTAGQIEGNAPREILFLPPRNPRKERWVGPRPGPDDPDISQKTGFAVVKPFPQMRASLEKLARAYDNFYTILPYEKELGGYPHEKEWTQYVQQSVPQAKLNDLRAKIGALRQIKSPGEIAFLTKAINASDDAHLAAMKRMRPGLYEYQVAATMLYTFSDQGCEAPAYAPIVGAGWNSTVLHYDTLSKKIADGDIVVLDVGGQFSGYAADITRTLPANGTFTPRQREIYEIVLGAQNAAIAALKPGMGLGRKSKNSLFEIAYNYINSHGKDKQGRPLGPYFIHGLGHHIGLNVHDAGDPDRPLEPGMVITIEPGIYITEENLGVRIEDNFLITNTGYKFLSENLPRSADEIEKIMNKAQTQPAQPARHD
ncbi:MAG TPA: Xaa-Pro peptidase family protein [Candidatus Dormibacteraeota bacterium]|nr:Xaa-Pro peptidase family protein [Candidatus Dormibacteraeota bacterium]